MLSGIRRIDTKGYFLKAPCLAHTLQCKKVKSHNNYDHEMATWIKQRPSRDT